MRADGWRRGAAKEEGIESIECSGEAGERCRRRQAGATLCAITGVVLDIMHEHSAAFKALHSAIRDHVRIRY